MDKLFQIYRSSAGSGKTRTLAKEYLKLALRYRSDYFKHILAVTFTNKSTQEMKDRIMKYLDDFIKENSNELSRELQTELKLDATTFQGYAREVQAEILHNYQEFSISTIDAFFQKVIRSFTREAGISGDYRLEVENDDVMEQVISNLIAELGESEQLTKWVVELALQNLENDRSWDMRQSLANFSNEIFREEFRAVEPSLLKITSGKNYFTDALKLLQHEKYSFIRFIQIRAKNILDDFHANGLYVDDFKWGKNGGAYSYFRKLAASKAVSDLEVSKRAENDFQDSKEWPSKNNSKAKEIMHLAKSKWVNQLNEIIEYHKKHFKSALSAEVALDNFYAYGLLTDISRKLSEFKKENNVMLLADAPQFLNSIIDNSDTPFVYEKTGSFYKNFLIDEFQDTSGLQWKNFLPLLTNSLDSGHRSLIVGDAKQAIYRWRGGDPTSIQKANEAIGEKRTEIKTLNQNFRSAKNIIDFNNELFKIASALISNETSLPVLSTEYFDVQQTAIRKSEGYVKIQFVKEEDQFDWSEIALEKTAQHIEELQSNGAKPNDIAIIVRKNEEGQQIISYLIDRKNSSKAKSTISYDIVSSESLRIDKAASVNLIVATLTYLLNPMDDIARAQLGYEYARHKKSNSTQAEVFTSTNYAIFENSLPSEFIRLKNFLKKLPLFELTESIIEIFELKSEGELPYLLAFQDLVLEFGHRERNDLGAFLVWWKENKIKKSIIAPSNANAMQLITIHKVKGLQFKYVIIPFCSWNMDHDGFKSPNLWVQSDSSIFKSLAPLPVKYASKLKDSYFKEEYDYEHSRILIDNLNLLYVACTRAELGLYAIAPDSGTRGFNNMISKILLQSIEQSAHLLKNWNASEKIWASGELNIDKESTQKGETLSLEHYNTGSWRTKLVIKHTAHPLESEEDDSRKKIRFGIYLHHVLSKIKYKPDINSAIDSLQKDGTIHPDEKETLIQKIEELMANPKIEDWFSEKWEVRNEVHSLLPKGKEYRIDRLLLKDRTAVVIDFKTGARRKEDQQQVADYCAMLTQMGFNAEGHLLYIADADVINIVPPKASKKKTENQLGLDF